MTKAFGLSTLLLALAACGDDKGGNKNPDAAVGMDTVMDDAPTDATPYVAPTPFAIAISATGPDQLMSLAAGPSGSFYGAGYASATAGGAKFVIVVKLTAAGALDTNFATGGIYTSTVEFKPVASGTDEIDIVVQSDGKIVVAATIANGVNPNDRDIGLFRIDAAGTLDTVGFGTAGTGGVSVLDLSTAHNTGTALVAFDSQRGLAVGPSDALYIHAVSRDMSDDAGTPRTDTDFTVAKLASNGVLALGTYGTAGKFLLDFTGNIAKANATAKGIAVLSDGSVIAGGYATTTAFEGAQAVLYRLTPAGVLDTTNWSATGGVFYDDPLEKQTEIYAFAVDGDRITTGGYGRATDTAGAAAGCCNQWVSLRFDTSDGTRDTAFGGATAGAVLIDPSAATVGDNCRNAIGMPGGRTALIGSAAATPSRDAALAIIKQNGQLDTGYGTGVNTFDLGGADDQWWGGAVNGGKLMLVGWRGTGAAQTDVANDNSYGVVLDVQ